MVTHTVIGYKMDYDGMLEVHPGLLAACAGGIEALSRPVEKHDARDVVMLE